MARVVLAMSGGVDSSVAALLLKDAGHEVIGLFMRTGIAHPQAIRERANHKKGCCSSLDAADARRVADQLGLPFYALDFAGEFGQIMDAFADDYLAGRTPNPCVLCNNWLKFGKLWHYGQQLGADFIATGHYARLAPCPLAKEGWGGGPAAREGLKNEERALDHAELAPTLLRSADAAKDQTYVLFGLPRELLPKLLLPLGGYTKDAVRRKAKEAGLPVFAKPDSVDLCFVPDGDAAAFVRQHRGTVPNSGPIVDVSGTIVGEHEGIEGFTVGQRKGLAVAAGSRRYVLQLVPESATVVVGPREAALKGKVVAERCNWLIHPPTRPFAAAVKYSYRDPAVAATVIPMPEERFEVKFAEPQFGVAPGQAAVVYRGDQLLGGGWISV